MIFHTNQQILNMRVIVFTISLFIFSSCIADYRDHFDAEHSTSPIVSSEYLQIVDGDTLWILPDENVKDKLIQLLSEAETRIWLEIYMLTDTDIISQLIVAHERWVDVRVILEGNVYGLPYANTRVLNTLKDAWVPVVYADGYQFTFTHAKFWIVDDRYYISTGNITKSFFQSNRDFVFSSQDTTILDFLLEVFSHDFDYITLNLSTIPTPIVLSPIDSRSKIEFLLQGAQSDITIYNQTLTDETIIDILREKEAQWVLVRVCTADNESNRESIDVYSFPWALVK